MAANGTRMTWGPFRDDLAADERKAQLRTLRALVKVLLGPRGAPAALALLRAEISDGDAALLTEASAEFDRLASTDARRVLASFASSLPERIAS